MIHCWAHPGRFPKAQIFEKLRLGAIGELRLGGWQFLVANTSPYHVMGELKSLSHCKTDRAV